MTTFLEESKLFILSTLMLIALSVLSVQLQQARNQDVAQNPANTTVTTLNPASSSETRAPQEVQVTAPLPPKPAIRGVYNEEEDD